MAINKLLHNETSDMQLKQKINSYFDMFDMTAKQKADVRGLLEAAISKFFASGKITSNIDVIQLQQCFKEYEIPEEPGDIIEYFHLLEKNILTHCINTCSPRFIGHMTSSIPFFIKLISDVIVATNQNVVKLETSKALSFVERQVLAMIHRLIYKNPDEFYNLYTQQNQGALGSIVSGGTIANITSIWCARNKSFAPKGNFKGIEKEGLYPALNYFGYNGAVIIGSNQMHYSFEKAADTLGIGSENLIKIPTDSNYRIDLNILRKKIAELKAEGKYVIALIGIAGSTNSGSIDPLRELAEIARDNNIHFHVDAAWGGPLLFSQKYSELLDGIELADSVTIDGHKQFYLPIGTGMVFFRDPGMAKFIERSAQYIIRRNSLDLGRYTMEGSRPGNALFLHAALSIIGAKGYEYLIENGIGNASSMAQYIEKSSDFELLNKPETNIVNYRYIPEKLRDKWNACRLSASDNQIINEFNISLQKRQRKNGKSFVSRTSITLPRYGKSNTIVVLRAVLANPLTTMEDIELVINEQRDIAAEIENSMESMSRKKVRVLNQQGVPGTRR
jgi:putative pyridoxal-dependent aspartate 1-decarboxylase